MARLRLPVLALPLLLMAANPNPVIAKRGADMLTLSQLRALISSLPPDRRARVSGNAGALKDFIRDTLLQRALVEQARSEKWDRRPDVRAALDRQRDAWIADSFLAGKTAVPAGFPSDDELRTAYEQNKGRLLRPRRYKLVQLFLSKKPGETSSRTRLSDVRARLMVRTEPFSAKTAQDSGLQFVDMGWVAESEIAPAIRPAIAGLQVGSITDPICMDGACHLLQLLDTQAAGSTPLPELRDALTDALRQRLQDNRKRAYASSLLKKTPVILDGDQLSRFNP